MSGPKHTPGPWRIDVDEDAHVKVVKDSAGGLVAELFRRDFDADPEHEANAILIAAAPRLAAALKRAMPHLEDHEDYERRINGKVFAADALLDLIDDARAALREAGVTDDA